jgi:hypothetical protein
MLDLRDDSLLSLRLLGRSAAEPHYRRSSRYLLRLKSSFSGNSRGLIRLGPISHLVNKFKGNVYTDNGEGI